MNTNVVDNKEKQRFELEVPGGHAIADYRLEGGTIVFTHTEVPGELRGQGYGENLARGALDLVRARNLKVVPQCPFIRKFIEKHAEYQNLLANE
jgi:predicted GNAT family acetyltransferase